MAFENPGYERSSGDWNLPSSGSLHEDRYSVRSAPISPFYGSAIGNRPHGKISVPNSLTASTSPTSPKIPTNATIPRPKSIGPYIPPPDYSPPSTPKLKSALKSRNYFHY